MKVRRNTLLLIAALVWSAAGFNILRIGLRSSGLAPERFIAVFYTGLGCALALAGVCFWGAFLRGPAALEEGQAP